MAATFADATMLRYYVKDLGTRLSDAELLEILEVAEGRVLAIIMAGDTTQGETAFTFNANYKRHLLLRETVLAWAALTVLAATPLSVTTLDYLYNAEDVYMNKYNHNLAILNDDKQGPRIVKAGS